MILVMKSNKFLNDFNYFDIYLLFSIKIIHLFDIN